MLEDLRRRESEKPRGLLREVVTNWQDGRIKLYLTDKALGFRHAHPELFHDGSYLPLEAAGPRLTNLCAFARNKAEAWCVTVAPRLTTQLAPAGRMALGATSWQETHLLLPASAPERWRNVLTGEEVVAEKLRDGRRRVKAADLLKRFPVALLQGRA